MNSEESTQAGMSAGVQAPRKQHWAQMVVLAALYAAPALVCTHLAVVEDPDVWWHLSTAQWILQHSAVPQNDPFSVYGAGKPWVAYSWLYELLILQLYKGLGLTGLVAYTAAMVMAITAALHRLNRRLQQDFTLALLLTFAGSFCLISLWTPRSWLLSILFFVLELDILMQARRTGKTRELYWLPVILALWANVHILFVFGLLIVGMALAEAVLAHWFNSVQARIGFGRLCILMVACVLATLLNPYGPSLYRVAYDFSSQHGAMSVVSELKSIPFRGLQDYGILLFTLAAAAVLGRAQKLLLFELMLVAFAVMVSFRSLRDEWVVLVVASAIIASGLKGDMENRFVLRAWAALPVVAAAGLIAFLGFGFQGVNNRFLSAQLKKRMPVDAVAFVKEKGYPGPVFDDYTWGGYLISNLGLPVVIDSRQNVFGDRRMMRSIATWGGAKDWASDPDLKSAGVIIGPANAPLSQLLRMCPGFDLAYEDSFVAVFVPRADQAAATHGNK